MIPAILKFAEPTERLVTPTAAAFPAVPLVGHLILLGEELAYAVDQVGWDMIPNTGEMLLVVWLSELVPFGDAG